MVITIKSFNNEYPIVIKNNCLMNLDQYINTKIKSIVITDDLVPSKYSDLVCSQLEDSLLYVMKHGEKHKTMKTVNDILKVMLENNFDRFSQVIALGGGVVGDLSGFVSSIYNRGIKFINIPTTTLSMIDSSVGGKVGVNLDDTKNVIGSFYNPEIVLIDTFVLDTLPVRHYNNGLVEALKMGLCLDKNLYNCFKDNFNNNIEEIIKLSIEAKKHVVEVDPKEDNLRKVLNFGHTIGHAIESCNLDMIYHGEAVALGMLYFIKDYSLKEEVKRILKKMNIENSLNINPSTLIDFIKHDKKKNNNDLTVVTLNSLTNFEFTKYSLDEVFHLLKEEYYE